MLEAILVVLCLLGLFVMIVKVGRSASAKLDSIYSSRQLAFERAMNGCEDGRSTPAGSIDDFANPPGGQDPDAERLEGSVKEGFQISAWGLNIAEAGTDVTVDTSLQSHGHLPEPRTYHSQSWVACIEKNHGAEVPWAGKDGTAIQNQLFAIVPYIWDALKPWIGIRF